jgi:hypothetical protein
MICESGSLTRALGLVQQFALADLAAFRRPWVWPLCVAVGMLLCIVPPLRCAASCIRIATEICIHLASSSAAGIADVVDASSAGLFPPGGNEHCGRSAG